MEKIIVRRSQLGHRMMQWHGGQTDPVYAVASFYIANKSYPGVAAVDDAIERLGQELIRQTRMFVGEIVSTQNTKDLQKFAGYSDVDLHNNIMDLTEIISALKEYRAKDYLVTT